jgi:Spy/CpxP family protein refolding chaperone
MKTTLKSVTIAAFWVSGVVFAQASPYAGQEQRTIKSLSQQEVAALLSGAGAGFARAAELNGYPGPMHVLELADRLALTAEQRAATQSLMAEHKARARTLGEQLVDAERDLDKLFAQRAAAADTVDAATRRVGLLQAELRAEHLKTHIAQTALLSGDQVRMYPVLRGYAADGSRDIKQAPLGDPAPHRRH